MNGYKKHSAKSLSALKSKPLSHRDYKVSEVQEESNLSTVSDSSCQFHEDNLSPVLQVEASPSFTSAKVPMKNTLVINNNFFPESEHIERALVSASPVRDATTLSRHRRTFMDNSQSSAPATPPRGRRSLRQAHVKTGRWTSPEDRALYQGVVKYLADEYGLEPKPPISLSKGQDIHIIEGVQLNADLDQQRHISGHEYSIQATYQESTEQTQRLDLGMIAHGLGQSDTNKASCSSRNETMLDCDSDRRLFDELVNAHDNDYQDDIPLILNPERSSKGQITSFPVPTICDDQTFENNDLGEYINGGSDDVLYNTKIDNDRAISYLPSTNTGFMEEAGLQSGIPSLSLPLTISELLNNQVDMIDQKNGQFFNFMVPNVLNDGHILTVIEPTFVQGPKENPITFTRNTPIESQYHHCLYQSNQSLCHQENLKQVQYQQHIYNHPYQKSMCPSNIIGHDHIQGFYQEVQTFHSLGLVQETRRQQQQQQQPQLHEQNDLSDPCNNFYDSTQNSNQHPSRDSMESFTAYLNSATMSNMSSFPYWEDLTNTHDAGSFWQRATNAMSSEKNASDYSFPRNTTDLISGIDGNINSDRSKHHQNEVSRPKRRRTRKISESVIYKETSTPPSSLATSSSQATTDIAATTVSIRNTHHNPPHTFDTHYTTYESYTSAISRAIANCPWSKLASETVPGRTGVQAQARWSEALDPQVKKGPWSEQEDALLLEGVEKSEKCWIWIADMIPGRTQRQCRTRWVQLSINAERRAALKILDKTRMEGERE
ncbi:hypothetical protein FBU30_007454 [Linnemannia zychae]|nr:hypothetical protein FBU30_007454 [Linnemannia zychae]